MATALIGATGLVGGTLLNQTAFDDLYHSKNIEEIAGRSYDLVVCAGAPAQKWIANREPESDRANLERLMRALAQVSARELILISTVDVFPDPSGVDEQSPTDIARLQPYGRHRRELEEFVASRFAHLTVRLPGLFGAGLKKNIIFDLLHDNQVVAIHCESRFQFYNLDRLWRDVQTARAAALSVVHFATEPVSVRDLARVGFGRSFEHTPLTSPASYDMRCRHAERFGGANGYLCARHEVLTDIAVFVARELRRRTELPADRTRKCA